MTISAQDVGAIAEALAAGSPVPDEGLLALSSSTDILTLAMLADERRQERHGRSASYVRVASVALEASGAIPALPPSAGEVRVVMPANQFDDMLDPLARLVREAGRVPVTACSLADLEATASAQGRSLRALCASLRATGVSAVADAPIDRLVAPEVAWSAARAEGLGIARVTVSRNPDAAGRVELVRRVAALQRAVGDVPSFAPLARAWNPAAPSTGYEDVRSLTLARLLLADVPSIQVDWALYGPKLAQVALTMGADDLDGVPAVDEAPDGWRRAPLEEVLRNIRAAGLTPVERDGLYRRVSA